MNNDKLNVAIIGCGCVAGYGHVPALVESDQWHVAAFVDTDRSRAEDFSQRFGGGQVYTDYQEVLDKQDIDAVAILTTPVQHSPIAIDAMQAGKHVFTEKPISHSTATAREMIDTAKRTNRKLFVGFLLRYTSCYKRMGKVIQSGMIGKPMVFRMMSFERYDQKNPFYWDRALNSFIKVTSPGMDCGTHYIDLMRWYSGAEAISVHGMGGRVHPDVPEGCFDWEAYQVTFDDGCRGYYETGWGYSFPANRIIKEAIGPDGYVGVRPASVIEGEESEAQVVFCPVGGEEQVLETSPWKGFDKEWEHFARIVREDLDPFAALEDAFESLRIVEAGNRSAREGITINLLEEQIESKKV
jgi:predicted dehydrogenase